MVKKIKDSTFGSANAVTNDHLLNTEEGATLFDENSEAPSGGKSLTIIAALEILNEEVRDSKLSDDFLGKNDGLFEYLTSISDLTSVQWVIVAILAESETDLSLLHIGRYLGLTRLQMYRYKSELTDLQVEKRWIIRKEDFRQREEYALVPEAMEALSNNRAFVPEDLSNLEMEEFAHTLVKHYGKYMDEHNEKQSIDVEWTRYLVRQNPKRRLCQLAMSLNQKEYSDILLMALIYDYIIEGDYRKEGISNGILQHCIIPAEFIYVVCEALASGHHELIKQGYVEAKCEDGMAAKGIYCLTKKAKEELLEGWKPYKYEIKEGETYNKDITRWNSILPKDLYYNPEVQTQVSKLFRMASGDNLKEIQSRLTQEKMRIGVAVLLEGGPGTGKTEMVKQLALQSQRDLVMVDLSNIRSKYVGESEENVAAIFSRYKRLCQTADRSPILFINECDGLLGKRSEKPGNAVDKMENTIQNLLLQALEDQVGFIVCTTNLAPSLDMAFERRFLFRIRVDMPNAEVRGHIMRSMLPALPLEDAIRLSRDYALSGGQIENITRKVIIENILEGKEVSGKQVEMLCKEECKSSGRSTLCVKIGF